MNNDHDTMKTLIEATLNPDNRKRGTRDKILGRLRRQARDAAKLIAEMHEEAIIIMQQKTSDWHLKEEMQTLMSELQVAHVILNDAVTDLAPDYNDNEYTR